MSELIDLARTGGMHDLKAATRDAMTHGMSVTLDGMQAEYHDYRGD